jgi:hypothetical protein
MKTLATVKPKDDLGHEEQRGTSVVLMSSMVLGTIEGSTDAKADRWI